jgi:hypothetical protein
MGIGDEGLMTVLRTYLLSEILEDKSNELREIEVKFVIRSFTNKETKYEVSYSHLIKRYVCSCPDFCYRRWASGEDCKHIKEVKKNATNV